MKGCLKKAVKLRSRKFCTWAFFLLKGDNGVMKSGSRTSVRHTAGGNERYRIMEAEPCMK